MSIHRVEVIKLRLRVVIHWSNVTSLLVPVTVVVVGHH